MVWVISFLLFPNSSIRNARSSGNPFLGIVAPSRKCVPEPRDGLFSPEDSHDHAPGVEFYMKTADQPRFRDKGMRETFTESQTRIRTMALIHE